MALLRTKDIRAMDAAAREKKLFELREELMHERGVAAMGGAPPNPGKIRALRKNIARIYTIQGEEAKLGGEASLEAKTAEPAGGEKPRKPKSTAERAPNKIEKEEIEDDEEDAP
jgi:large subunit ribosomal protein L29